MFTIAVTLLNLKVKPFKEPFNINQLNLVQNAEAFKSWLSSDPNIALNFGRNHIYAFLQGPYLFVHASSSKLVLDKLLTSTVEALSMQDVFTLQTFFSSLWFIRDNSVNLGKHFMHSKDENIYQVRDRHITLSNAKGGFQTETFSHEELTEAWKIYVIIYKLTEVDKSPHSIEERAADPGSIQSGGINESNYNERNRIDRALIFLESARISTLLPMKIAFYIGCLECLFSTNPGEITHKVSERVAFYLGGNTLFTFKSMKNFYDIRSQYIHGQILPKGSRTTEELLIKCVELDEILRRVLTKVVLHDSDKFINTTQEQLNQWFESLVFTVR